MPRLRTLLSLSLLVNLCIVALTARAQQVAPPTYDVYALRYATLAAFPTRGLIAGADTARRTDIAMMVWLLRGSDGRNVLVDAGFYRDKFLRQWHPKDFIRPSEAVAKLGLHPEDISDVIISHTHWDHLDGADLFPNARIWIQRDEFTHYTDSLGLVRNRSIDPEDAQMLASLARAGRVSLIPGDSTEILPGVVVFTGGKHTYGSQYATVRTTSGTVVIASDNVYLYENLQTRRPIAQALDTLSNLAAQQRMLRLASDPRLIVPGHDPLVFERFPTPGNRVARIVLPR